MGANDGFIGIDELATHLKVKKRTVYYLAQSRQIPHYRVGRLIRFKLSEIEEWMKTKKYEPVHPPYDKLE
ncbi:MAG TPA: helix-turn-helix domain-containing protein [Thermodesulfobacteriota bacterium]|nr:helix-turn-helix domain-containing protein [Thermodesulfobacteriota bacterium]